MALIKCPECGRENVSSSAVSCPGCGYGISAHFEAIRAAEEAERLKEEADRQEEIEKEQSQKREKEAFERRLQSVEMPEKPKVSKAYFLYLGIVIVYLIGVLMNDYDNTINNSGYWKLALMMIAVPTAYNGWLYINRLQYYKMAIANPKQYRINKVLHEDARMEYQKMARVAEISKSPICPNCHSHRTERIGVISRVASVAAIGLASSKIGKQYRCKNCKHMW